MILLNITLLLERLLLFTYRQTIYQNFNTYILGLRIYFYVEKLKTYRKHLIKALSFALNLNHAESFSKHLLKKSGIFPSYFVKELEK